MLIDYLNGIFCLVHTCMHSSDADGACGWLY